MVEAVTGSEKRHNRGNKLFGKMSLLGWKAAVQRRIEIHIDPHTLQRAEERGTSEEEVKDVINTGFAVPARYERLGKGKVYHFGQPRHGIYYEHKRVEVIYAIERETITTVTVFVFYGRWEGQGADSV